METKNKLHIKLVHLEPQDSVVTLCFWGEIKIFLTENGIEHTLLQAEWDVDEFIESFADRIDSLMSNSLPQSPISLTLAQQLEQMTQNDYGDDEENFYWHDLLYKFRNTHSLNLWLRGAQIPEIIIGQKHNEGEISYTQWEGDLKFPDIYKEGNWGFKFDLQDFLIQVELESRKFLMTTLTLHPDNEQVTKRANALIEQLDQHSLHKGDEA